MADHEPVTTYNLGHATDISLQGLAPFLGLTVHVMVFDVNGAVVREAVGALESVTRDYRTRRATMSLNFCGGVSLLFEVLPSFIDIHIVRALPETP